MVKGFKALRLVLSTGIVLWDKTRRP